MVTRRRFLETGVLLSAGVLSGGRSDAYQRGLEQFAVPARPCTADELTPAAADGGTYRPGAQARTSLVEPGTIGAKLALSGSVVGLKCGPIKDARIDFWHPDGRGVLDGSGFRFRGHQLTGAEGRYALETIVPGAATGRPPWIGARLQPPGQPGLTTRLFLPDHPANPRDPSFKPQLVMKKGAQGAFTFDFVLDL